MPKYDMPCRLLVDSGYWMALYDVTDPWHIKAIGGEDLVQDYPVIVPWPVLYETVGTRLVKRREFLGFERVFRRPNTLVLDDTPYRDASAEEVFAGGARALSLVDLVLRRILEDRTVRIEGMLTFNPKDFADVCAKRDIEIVAL